MNYFRKLIKYMKDSYNIEHLFSLLKDGRKNPTYKTKNVMLILLIGFLLRIESLNELNNMLKEKEFKHVFPQKTRIPSVDTIRDTVKVLDLDGLKYANDQIVKKAVKNKVYDKGTIDGYNVTAMDGTKFFGSNKKKCTDCLAMEKDGKTHSFHSGVVMSTIGEGPTLVLGFDMYKPGEDSTDKDEGELSVSKRLLSEVVSRHRNVIDIVVYDALACNSVWINHCIRNQVDTVVRVKKNNNNSIKEVKKKTNKMEPVEVWADENGYQEIKVYESFFHMDNVEPNLRYVKYAMKDNNKKRTQIMIVTTCLKLSLKSIYKMIRARWLIENSVFNNLKNNCSMDHCFVHGGKATEAILYLIFIASNIMQLFIKRRLRKTFPTQKELVRILLKGLYFIDYRSGYLFNSS